MGWFLSDLDSVTNLALLLLHQSKTPTVLAQQWDTASDGSKSCHSAGQLYKFSSFFHVWCDIIESHKFDLTWTARQPRVLVTGARFNHHPHWHVLFALNGFFSIALVALDSNLFPRVAFLPCWWSGVPHSEYLYTEVSPHRKRYGCSQLMPESYLSVKLL